MINEYKRSLNIVDYLARMYRSFRPQAERLKSFYRSCIEKLKENPLAEMVHEIYHGLGNLFCIRRRYDPASVEADEGLVEALTEETLGSKRKVGDVYHLYKQRVRDTLQRYFGTSKVGEILGNVRKRGYTTLRSIGDRIRRGYKSLFGRRGLSYGTV